MAAGGGGSWKVAYADFVTAMMAFFLVMWIGAQDQKVKQAVANYFVDPSGVAKKPAKTGAVFNAVTYGSLPQNESVAMGRGRNSYTDQREAGPATKQVGDWLHADAGASAYWREQARRCRERAAAAPEVRDRQETADEVAARQLSRQLRDELTRGVPSGLTGVYQDLMYGAMGEVNWQELAEDLLAH